MKLFSKAKDGGPDSPVDAYFVIEIKNLFSIALLKFNKGAREQFHTHAFNALTWFLDGDMEEEDVDGSKYQYKRSLKPKFTPSQKCHRVIAHKDSWCITLRGPWAMFWTEYDKEKDKTTLFGHGRVVYAKVTGFFKYKGL